MAYTIITGASAGIGEVFAKRIAQNGEDIILVARRIEKLETLANQLRNECKVKVETIALDLAQSDSALALAEQVEKNGWAIGGLINNAGFGDRGMFEALTLERQLQMIQLNVTTLVELTHRLLPKLRQQTQAYVINVASTAAFQAGPKMAVYYATKAFVLSFSEGLYEELKADGIHVSALCPGATDSEFASEANMSDTKLFKAGAMSAEAVVDQALRKKNRAIVITGWKNVMGVWMGKVSPRAVTRKMAGWLQA